MDSIDHLHSCSQAGIVEIIEYNIWNWGMESKKNNLKIKGQRSNFVYNEGV